MPFWSNYMVKIFKSLLTLVPAAFVLYGFSGASVAQEEGGVAHRPPVFAEMFSSQACVFCPPADRVFGELMKREGVIGLSCHVNYFDVKEGSLARPFCTARQLNYTRFLKTGPLYTPQMILNGHIDVVGYELENVSHALRKAQEDDIQMIDVRPDDKGGFTASLKKIELKGNAVSLWMAVIDKPQSRTIAAGGNKGQEVTYYQVADVLIDLGEWDGAETTTHLTPQLSENHAGFVIAAQSTVSGRILAAGAYIVQGQRSE